MGSQSKHSLGEHLKIFYLLDSQYLHSIFKMKFVTIIFAAVLVMAALFSLTQAFPQPDPEPEPFADPEPHRSYGSYGYRPKYGHSVYRPVYKPIHKPIIHKPYRPYGHHW